jgi:hypothetical protein
MHHFHWKFRGFDGNQWICQVFLSESNDYTDLRNSLENIRIPMSAGIDVYVKLGLTVAHRHDSRHSSRADSEDSALGAFSKLGKNSGNVGNELETESNLSGEEARAASPSFSTGSAAVPS